MQSQEPFLGVTAAQRDVIAYWKSCRDSQGLVSRTRINPGALGTALASISIVEHEESGALRFRIAGTRVQSLFGMDVAGQNVRDVLGKHARHYTAGLKAAIERRAPTGGLIGEAPRYHAWLRLPLVNARGELTQVLCHDETLTHLRDVTLDAALPMPLPRAAA